MSAELLARKAVAELRRIQTEKIANLRKCKPRSPTVIEGATVAAATAEEIALYAVDLNATIDAFNVAIQIIDEEFEKLTRPEEPPADPTPDDPQARKNLYG